MSDQDLLNLKKGIETAKRKQSEAEGKKKALLETLATEFGCKTIQQAQKELTKFQKELDVLKKDKQEKIDELEKDYEF